VAVYHDTAGGPCGLSLRRQLLPVSTNKAGYFSSSKLGRVVQYESLLELEVFQAFDLASSVAAYQEQPLQVDVSVDGVSFRYTPDVVVAR
jgi:hypothetical protein